MGCLASQLAQVSTSDRDGAGCSAKMNSIIKAHNSLLQEKLAMIGKLYPQSTISYADTYGAYMQIIGNYQSYGFTEPFKACCGTASPKNSYNFDPDKLCGTDASSECQDPTKYISWDGIHLTDAMNGKISELLLNKGYCKPSLAELCKKKKGL